MRKNFFFNYKNLGVHRPISVHFIHFHKFATRYLMLHGNNGVTGTKMPVRQKSLDVLWHQLYPASLSIVFEGRLQIIVHSNKFFSNQTNVDKETRIQIRIPVLSNKIFVYN